MVFSSVPLYLDPPNWNQQLGHQPAAAGGAGGGGGVDAHRLPPPPPIPAAHVGNTARPGSMAERARLAKVPQPEPGLKCPRCDSTNTKFCYFNNYSLAQPRHFCKTCRRYWTRGGALRSVPVGGGCRRNKRSKSGGAPKSSTAAATDQRQLGTAAASFMTLSEGASAAAVLPSGSLPSSQLPGFMASLHQLPDYAAAAAANSVRLHLGGMQHLDTADFQVGAASPTVGLDPWKLQQVPQYPFMAGLEPVPAASSSPMGLFPFDGAGHSGVADHGDVLGSLVAGQVHGKPTPPPPSRSLFSQLASVKMEDNRSTRELSLPKHYLGIPGNGQYLIDGSVGYGASIGSGSGGGGGGGWTDISGFNPSSTSNIM